MENKINKAFLKDLFEKDRLEFLPSHENIDLQISSKLYRIDQLKKRKKLFYYTFGSVSLGLSVLIVYFSLSQLNVNQENISLATQNLHTRKLYISLHPNPCTPSHKSQVNTKTIIKKI